jgi:hypothetical protein
MGFAVALRVETTRVLRQQDLARRLSHQGQKLKPAEAGFNLRGPGLAGWVAPRVS